ncbi:MAG TPA: GDP-L-fucose synthase [Rhizomicrobium sp.]|nr:GDP-L-fucose synthase [Rhizomicrobium sp.]
MSDIFSLKGKTVYVAGHRGMVGSALVRRLEREGCEILTAPRQELDLRRQGQVEDWMNRHRPQAVFLSAATVGGIYANDSRPATFLYDNLMIEANLIEGARAAGVEKLLYLGSSCIYPRMAPQPIAEDSLLTGPLEPTNEWYAIAKIAGIKLCQSYRRQHGSHFISVMPTNLYGPGDNFDLLQSHVVPALIRKADDARRTAAATLPVWGSGQARREFMHVDDLADACVFLMENYDREDLLNVGTGEDLTIAELAQMICRMVGFTGTLAFDSSKPDGTPRKLLDVSRLHALGWRHRIGLEEGLAGTYAWFNAHAADRRDKVAVNA